jgi:hypothetical protein
VALRSGGAVCGSVEILFCARSQLLRLRLLASVQAMFREQHFAPDGSFLSEEKVLSAHSIRHSTGTLRFLILITGGSSNLLSKAPARHQCASE